MLSKKLGGSLDRLFAPLALRVPFTPNVVTISGFIFTIFACSVLSSDLMTGGILVLTAGFFDMLDGAVARAKNMVSSYGAYLDSVLDRYADAGIMLAVFWNMFSRGNTVGMLLALASLIGSFLVSYARARAEGLGVSCSHGLMERPERIILVAVGAMSGHMIPVLWVMTILTHFTVIQRILHTQKQLYRKGQ